MASYSFDEAHAKAYGVNEAIFLNSIIHWLNKNAIEGRNIQDGTVWTYNTHEEFAANFPWLNAKQIGRIIDKLKKAGMIEIRKYEHFNRRSWITVCDLGLLNEEVRKLLGQNREMEDPKSGNGRPEIGKWKTRNREMTIQVVHR